jgi:hypothetical protein
MDVEETGKSYAENASLKASGVLQSQWIDLH